MTPDNPRYVIWRNPLRWARAVRRNMRVHDFAHDVGMDVLQRIADGADEVNVRLIGPRNDGKFLDTDLRVQSVHPTDSGEAS